MVYPKHWNQIVPGLSSAQHPEVKQQEAQMARPPQQMTRFDRQQAHGYLATQNSTVQFSRANGLPPKFEDSVPAQRKIPQNSMTEPGKKRIQDKTWYQDLVSGYDTKHDSRFGVRTSYMTKLGTRHGTRSTVQHMTQPAK